MSEMTTEEVQQVLRCMEALRAAEGPNRIVLIITNATHGSKLAPKKEGGLEKGVGVKPYYDHAHAENSIRGSV